MDSCVHTLAMHKKCKKQKWCNMQPMQPHLEDHTYGHVYNTCHATVV